MYCGVDVHRMAQGLIWSQAETPDAQQVLLLANGACHMLSDVLTSTSNSAACRWTTTVWRAR